MKREKADTSKGEERPNCGKKTKFLFQVPANRRHSARGNTGKTPLDRYMQGQKGLLWKENEVITKPQLM